MTATLHGASGSGSAPPTPPAPTAARPAASDRSRDPRWARPALLVLLAATAALYLYDLSASGWANSFYSAAVQAGSESWKAFFFGSSDAANSITVDKPPAALWIMALSARVFGVNSWSILVPQALMGVASVGIVYATVRRRSGPAAGLIAGAVLALTPVAALMFRFNNPDALLVLLLTGAGYAVLRAVEDGRTRWLVLAGTLIGFGFLAKMMQAFLVLPAFALVYLMCAPVAMRRRIGQLLLGGLALAVSAGWWIALVELWPTNSRPYIGGSQNNSILELTLGYNGLGRLNGDETGSVGGAGGGGRGQGGGWGETGIGRLFNAEMGGHIAWLLPAALILLAAGLWVTRRARRTDATRAAFLLWGSWLLTHWLVFSFMQGIFHQYYNVALAPAIAALVGMGSAVLGRLRRHPAAAAVLAATTATTAVWAYVLLGRTADWYPWLRYAVLACGLAGALGLLVAGRSGRLTRHPVLAVTAAAVALVAALAGPAAYTLSTAAAPHTGSLPTAGPDSGFGRGPGGGPGGRGGPDGDGPGGQAGQRPQTPPQGQGRGQGQPPGQGQLPAPGQAPGVQGDAGRARGGGGAGGLINGSDPSDELVSILGKGSGSYTWVAAAIGSQNASGYQLATGDPVMPIGGFNGTDPSPTLEQFQQLVNAGRIHWFIGGGGGPGGGRDSASSGITAWVEENFTATTVDGVTLYDLSG